MILHEPDWSNEDDSEVSRHKAAVPCPYCKTLFPAHSEFKGTFLVKITLDDHAATKVIADQPVFVDDDDDRLRFYDEIPKEPYDMFNETHGDTQKLLAEHGKDQGDHLVNRMIFAHQVAALEAYLGDRIRKGVRWHKTAMAQLVSSEEFSKEKFSLSRILASPDFVAKQVDRYLQDVMYHNLNKVDFLYRTAFGIRILGDKPIDERLFKAIEYRHDCVHRNGITKEGKKLNVFTKEYIYELSDVMQKLVGRIEREIIYQEYYDEPLPRSSATEG